MSRLLTLSGIFVIILSAPSLADLNRDDMAKDKPVWTDHWLSLIHQFQVNIPFNQLNKHLCLISQTNYQEYTNLNSSNETPAHAYLTNVRERDCGIDMYNEGGVVQASQASPSSPIKLNFWRSPSSERTRNNIEVEVFEEASQENIFGIMNLNIEIIGLLSNKMLLKWFSTSEEFTEETIRYQVAEYLDGVLIDPTLEPGQKEEFYGVDILYNTDTGTGFGSIISKFFRSTSYSSFGGGLYPSGTPIVSEATNVAFDDNHIYAVRTRDLNLSGNLGSEAVAYEACINRSQYWTYVPAFGYGVYDENGDRVTTEFIGQTTNSSGNTISFQWTDVSGEGDFYLVTPTACRSLKDGQVLYDTNLDTCPSSNGSGIADLPTGEISDLVTIEDASGNEYLVRQLVERRAYSEVDMAVCETTAFMELREAAGEDAGSSGLRTVKTPNHSFFENTWIETNTPPSGAVLANSWKDDADRDPVFSGNEFLPLDDADSDGTLNFQDAFPLDAERNTDSDYDGIDDAEDSDTLQFSFDHSSFSASNATEVITRSMVPRATPVTPCPGGSEGSICWDVEQIPLCPPGGSQGSICWNFELNEISP
ncbi:MAG: hypothetical protein CMP95_09660 [Gammaproteobacteria bacterium]|nr:hypothetical protein [Gammaproteobacteria bacterium]